MHSLPNYLLIIDELKNKNKIIFWLQHSHGKYSLINTCNNLLQSEPQQTGCNRRNPWKQPTRSASPPKNSQKVSLELQLTYLQNTFWLHLQFSSPLSLKPVLRKLKQIASFPLKCDTCDALQSINKQNDTVTAVSHSSLSHTPVQQRSRRHQWCIGCWRPLSQRWSPPPHHRGWWRHLHTRRQPVRISGDTDHLGTSEWVHILLVCMHEYRWQMQKALVQNCQLPWRWLLRHLHLDLVSAGIKQRWLVLHTP